MWRSDLLSYRTGAAQCPRRTHIGVSSTPRVEEQLPASLTAISFRVSHRFVKKDSRTRGNSPLMKHLTTTKNRKTLQKGGVPAAPSGTATLLRLSPNHQFYPRPTLAVTDFRHPRLSWLDGRCVQGPGTYSPRHSDSRLLAIPASCSRVADYNPNWDWVFVICLTSPSRFTLLPAIVARV